MASIVEIERYNLIPLSVTCPCAHPCRPLSKKTLILARWCSKLNRRLVLNGSKATWSISAIRHLVTAVARAEPDRLGQEDVKEEVDKGHKLPEEQESVSEPQQKGSQLRKRIVFGLGIGISVGGVVLAGEWVFTVALAAAMFVGARIGASWPVLFGGQAHWTVGLVASLIAISSIIAADTYAFMGGKVFGLLK